MTNQKRQADVLAQVFRVLGDSTRLRIWRQLQEGELNVTKLCERLKVPQPTVSHHLGIMRMSRLVTNRRSGKEIYYSLNDLTREGAGRAMRSLVNCSSCVRIGPLVLCLAKD